MKEIEDRALSASFKGSGSAAGSGKQQPTKKGECISMSIKNAYLNEVYQGLVKRNAEQKEYLAGC